MPIMLESRSDRDMIAINFAFDPYLWPKDVHCEHTYRLESWCKASPKNLYTKEASIYSEVP